MNPRAGSKPAYSLSRGAPSASWVLLHTMPLEYDSIAAGGCQHKFSRSQTARSTKNRLVCRFFTVENDVEFPGGDIEPERAGRLSDRSHDCFPLAATPGLTPVFHQVLQSRYSS